MTVEVRKFTDAQLAVLLNIVAAGGEKHAAMMTWLYDHYRIRLTNFVHDEVILEVPESLTEEQADVITMEVKTLFG